MDPPRRPGSGWLQNPDGNSKNQPKLAPTPDRSQITRTAPLPADLIARNGGDPEEEEAKRAERARKAAAEQEQEEELCAICYDQLPDVGRGIIACGHVYCFACIHKWCKTQNECPGCRMKIRRVLKTLSRENQDDGKEGDFKCPRKKRDKKSKKSRDKKQRDIVERRAGRVKTQGDVVTKTFRIRPTSLKPTPAQQRAEPHPEAPGGWMYAEAQEARQRLQQQQQQQQQRIQPVQAQGVLAEMAESIRLADAGELSPDEVEVAVRQQAATADPPSPFHPPSMNAALEVQAERERTRQADRARRSIEAAEGDLEREAQRDQQAGGGGGGRADGGGGGGDGADAGPLA